MLRTMYSYTIWEFSTMPGCYIKWPGILGNIDNIIFNYKI